MSYNVQESSREDGQPVEYYEFVLADEQFNYTSGEDETVIGALTYTPIAIERSQIFLGTEVSRDILIITMPLSASPAERYILIVPGQIATLTIKRRHRTDTPTPELITIFKGLVRSASYTENGYTAQLAVVPLTYGLGREVPRITFQGLCNYVLYDNHCTVLQGAYDFTGPVTLVDGDEITITGVTAQPDDYYTGGFVQWEGNDFRLILDHVGDIITVLMPFPDDVTGENLTVFAGCDHTIATCKTKFDNVVNYGGFAFVPKKDIFKNGLD